MIQKIKERLGRYNRIMDILTVICLYLIVLYHVLLLIVPTRVYIIENGLEIISSILALAGFGLFCWDLVISRNFLKSQMTRPLILTIAILMLSTVFNTAYGIIDNIKVIVWQIVLMLLIFTIFVRFSKEELKKVAYGLYCLVTMVHVPAVVYTLREFFQLTCYTVVTEEEIFLCGFWRGRLRGIFNGIYYQGIFTLLLAIASIYYAIKLKRVWQKFCCIIISLMCLAQETLGDARSLQVGAIVAVLVVMFLVTWNCTKRWKDSKQLVVRLLTCFCVALGSGVLLFAARTGFVWGLKAVALEINSNDSGATSQLYNESNVLVSKQGTYLATITEDGIQMDRDHVEGDISSSRTIWWKDYLTMWCQDGKSLLMGVSPGYYRQALWNRLPDSETVQRTKVDYPNLYERELVYETHNAYISIVVASGILGVVAIGWFLTVCVRKVLVFFDKAEKVSIESVVLLLMLLIVFVAIFFEADVFYKCTSTSSVFWFIAGLMVKEIEE